MFQPAYASQRFFGERFTLPPETQLSLGSGVIVSREGYILTNDHVVEGVTDIQVTLHDGRTVIGKTVGTDPDTDIFYSDEDKIDADNRRYDPQFKPDWSPELFLSYNYVNHFTCMRRSLFEEAGRLRPGFEGGQDYDLLLRATERTERIHHEPRVLYHWRSLPTSTAAVAAVKPVMFTSCERGLLDRLARQKIDGRPYTPAFAERLRLPISLLDFPDDGPSVAVSGRSGPYSDYLRHCCYWFWPACSGGTVGRSRLDEAPRPPPQPTRPGGPAASENPRCGRKPNNGADGRHNFGDTSSTSRPDAAASFSRNGGLPPA